LFIAKQKTGKIQHNRKPPVDPEKFEHWSQDTIDHLHSNFVNSTKAQEYMSGRGFSRDTTEFFQIGYSPSRILDSGAWRPEMVTAPMHDYKGRPIGLVGRTIAGKDFKNSKGLPRKYTAFNIHRARRAGGAVIVTESSFDAMRVHQAGYPNVVAILGGSFSEHIAQQLDRYFTKVIIMTDYDAPGRELGKQVVSKMRDKRVMWAAYDDYCVYPHKAKDAGDMTDDEIRQCLKHPVSNAQYVRWNPLT
jgi:DNA primase